MPASLKHSRYIQKTPGHNTPAQPGYFGCGKPRECGYRYSEGISSEEIINAVKEVLCQQISLSETDLVRETAKKFGYTRAVGITESVISYTLKKALTAGLIKKSESGNISAK